jgi:hypothetical protein
MDTWPAVSPAQIVDSPAPGARGSETLLDVRVALGLRCSRRLQPNAQLPACQFAVSATLALFWIAQADWRPSPRGGILV